MASYGLHLGMAFQMIDDALDYGSSQADIGKNIGDDLTEGKPTLPLIRAMTVADEPTRTILREVIEQGGADRVEEVRMAIESTDAIAYTAALAKEEAGRAKQAIVDLPKNSYLTALMALADFAVDRPF